MVSKMKWGDFIIIGCVLCLAAVIAIWLGIQNQGDVLYAEVWQNGELAERIKLSDTTDYTIDIKGHNHIGIKGGTVQMMDADCYDRVCVRSGTIRQPGQAIVCLPNKVIVKIVAENQTIDAVVS